VFCVLAFVGTKIQSEYSNIMSGAALLTFIIILALQLAPAPNVDIAGVTHAIFRAGLAAFVVFILLAVACPFTVCLWNYTFLLAGQWCFQLEQEVRQWNNSRALYRPAERIEVVDRPVVEPVPAPSPPPEPDKAEPERPLRQKVIERLAEIHERAAVRELIAQQITDETERKIALAGIEQAKRDELAEAFRRT